MQPEIIVVRNLDQVIDALGADALESEMLGPLIERVFGILTRLGLLPEPPEVIQGQEFSVEYVSPIRLGAPDMVAAEARDLKVRAASSQHETWEPIRAAIEDLESTNGA